MRNTFIRWLTKEIYPILIAFVVGFLIIANYVPGTILTGWDNLHSEFNLSLNISRSLSAVWQEYQGVGLLGGMAHAADLSRELVLALVSPVIPLTGMRYFWTFLMLFVGPMGAYYLFFYLSKGRRVASFVGAIFYVLNLATIQYFYVPYETFVSFFGFLPWFIFSSLWFLHAPSKPRALFVLALFLLGSSAFYVQTLFLVTMLLIGVFALEKFLRHRKTILPAIRTLALTIFAASAYWLLPALYFTTTNVQVVSDNRINTIATAETRYMNQSFGDLAHITKLQGFWFEYIDTQGGKYDYLLKSWREYLSRPGVETILASLFLVVCAGYIATFFMKKHVTYRWAPLAALLLCMLMLSSGNGILGGAFSLLSDKIPLFGQLFRSSFTKWSPAAALFYGWGITACLTAIAQVVGRFRKGMVIYPLAAALVFGGIFLSTRPVFQGDLISSNMRLRLPQEYTDLFRFFDGEPAERRITFLPAQSFWGWNFYDWGYRGSGFLWYGIKQPILDRAFDVWSAENESYYIELETAVYRNDPELLRQVFEKYDVSYALVDSHVIVPESSGDGLQLSSLPGLLSKAGMTRVWSEGKLEVYAISTPSNSFVQSQMEASLIQDKVSKNFLDIHYENKGDYLVKDGLVYPFGDLLQKKLTSPRFQTIDGQDYLKLSLPVTEKPETLVIPPITSPTELSGKISYTNQTVTLTFYDPAFLNGQSSSLTPLFVTTNRKYQKIAVAIGDKIITLSQGETTGFEGVTINTEKDTPLYVFNMDTLSTVSFADQPAEYNPCWEREHGKGMYSVKREGDLMSIVTNDVVACTSLKIGSFVGDKALVTFSLPYRSDTVARPDFCIVQEGDVRCLHDEIFYSETASREWSEVTRNVIVNGNTDYWSVLSARPSDTPGEAWTIQYKLPRVTVAYAPSTFTIRKSFWDSLTHTRSISLQSTTDEVYVQVPLSKHAVDVRASGRGGAYNCDLFKRGSVGRDTTEAGVVLRATGFAAECDYRLLPNLTLSKDYIIRFQGENTLGRSLKVYLFNERTQRNDIEAVLQQGSFDDSLVALRSLPDPSQKDLYTLNFETRSFGQDTENRLDSVIAYGAPLSWLASWSITLPDTTTSQTFVDAQFTPQTKWGTWLYKGTLVSESEGSSLITLSQGYNSGWIAYANGHIVGSTRFNSWANGWVLPVHSGSQSVAIFYVPQILEFIGFVAAGGLVILFIRRERVAKKKVGR